MDQKILSHISAFLTAILFLLLTVTVEQIVALAGAGTGTGAGAGAGAGAGGSWDSIGPYGAMTPAPRFDDPDDQITSSITREIVIWHPSPPSPPIEDIHHTQNRENINNNNHHHHHQHIDHGNRNRRSSNHHHGEDANHPPAYEGAKNGENGDDEDDDMSDDDFIDADGDVDKDSSRRRPKSSRKSYGGQRNRWHRVPLEDDYESGRTFFEVDDFEMDEPRKVTMPKYPPMLLSAVPLAYDSPVIPGSRVRLGTGTRSKLDPNHNNSDDDDGDDDDDDDDVGAAALERDEERPKSTRSGKSKKQDFYDIGEKEAGMQGDDYGADDDAEDSGKSGKRSKSSDAGIDASATTPSVVYRSGGHREDDENNNKKNNNNNNNNNNGGEEGDEDEEVDVTGGGGEGEHGDAIEASILRDDNGERFEGPPKQQQRSRRLKLMKSKKRPPKKSTEESAMSQNRDKFDVDNRQSTPLLLNSQQKKMKSTFEPPKIDTLVTVQEGDSKQGKFRWRIVQSMAAIGDAGGGSNDLIE